MTSNGSTKWISTRVQQANTRKTDEKQAPKVTKMAKVQEVPVEVPQSTIFESREATDTLSNLAQYSSPVTYQLDTTKEVVKPAELSNRFHTVFKEECEKYSSS